MKTIKVQGKTDELLEVVGYGSEFPGFKVAAAVEVTTDRSIAGEILVEHLDENDVVELTFDDGIRRWVTVKELEQEFQFTLREAETSEVIDIPPRLPPVSSLPSPSRGAADWVLRGLRVLKYEPLAIAAERVADAWDQKLMEAPGLYSLDKNGRQSAEVVDLPKINASKPVLLFLHGTFSSTQGSFGKLPQEAWSRLYERYGTQMFAYDHYTLSLSPIDNALDLVQKLPKNARLHLVTHSRGGLIGELLARSSRIDSNGKRMDSKEWFDQIDQNLAVKFAPGQGDANELVRLAAAIKEKNISVERFVRIACPARGTTLASGRLDRWLELIVNVVEKVFEPTGLLFSVLADLLLQFKKQGANPDAMPGLASMVPESGFIRMVNRPDVTLNVDLCVVAGDVEKNDILGRLAIFFADLFYFEEHDLVVQTRAMYGGARPGNGIYFFHKGTDVNHFHYFANQKTAEKIVDALLLDSALLAKSEELEKMGFRPLKEAFEGKAIAAVELLPFAVQKRSGVPQPVVYVLPGIMGTHLSTKKGPIWLDLLALAEGGIMNLGISNPDVKPFKLVALAYANLVDYLSATHEVIPFPYDWRLSILDEANRLAGDIQKKLKQTEQPIRILAHSMGGLVARAMIGQHPTLWEEMCKRKGSRFVMLGTPNRGAHKITRLLLGQEQTLKMLALLDLHNSKDQMLKVISRFPGVLQMLPMDDDEWDFFDARTWESFEKAKESLPWAKPLQEELDAAKSFQKTLNSMVITDKDPILYVAGTARGAPVGVKVSGTRIIFEGTDQGDGTVTWKSGILPELSEKRTWYMLADHGKMASRREYFPAIYELLHEGTTDLLKQHPEETRGVESPYALPEDEEQPQLFPNQDDLEQVVLKAEARPLSAPPVQPVRVSVAHGNLLFCDNPVAAGHYEGDSIFSAEQVLNNTLDGRLEARHRLGRYAGPEGTSVVILNGEGRKPGGAIIVGLGKAGELSARRLALAFANAMREYAITMVDNANPAVKFDNQLKVSTLLIGAGGQGLTVAVSVDAILNGVLEANDNLSQVQDSLKNVRIAEIEFIELYKDQAILAARAVRSYKERPEFTVTKRLRSFQGGFERVVFDEPPGWWSRIYVRTGKENSLIFSLPSGRARAEESQQAIQEGPIDSLVTQAVTSPRWDQKIANTMFELIIPNRLKGSFRDLSNFVLVLDQEAAHYPWELLYDRRAGEHKPLVVRAGLIRQFSTGTFQERVVDVKNKNVLVVGNPAKTGFADLPGAQREAQLVQDKFTKYEFRVTSAIHSEYTTILNSLFANDYRVLHLAGHGVFRRKVEDANGTVRVYTGMVIGDGVYLTANEIGSKLDIPELVFINCCHLGNLDREEDESDPPEEEFHKLAASLSQKLIEMGVKAVIAAGWAVDDSAALTFAEVFYEQMLTGSTFGNAVTRAREKTYNLHKDRTNTWAAYQCYGDPSYRLVEMSPSGALGPDPFEDIEEAITAVRQWRGRAQTTAVEGRAYLQEKAIGLLKRIGDESSDWLEDSRLQEALGELFGEVYMFDEAIKYYQMALENQHCNASIKTIEQLANFRIRMAVKDLEPHPEHYEKSKKVIKKELATLKTLTKTLKETPERLSLIGSAHKRLALISAIQEPGVCEQALEEMEVAYCRAWEMGGRKKLYPLTNHLTAMIVRQLRSGIMQGEKIPSELRNLAAQAKKLAENDRLNTRDEFWAGIGYTDVRLLEYLIDSLRPRGWGLSEERVKDLLDEYRSTWKRYGSSRELNSIIENYDFLTKVLDGKDVSKKLGEIRSALELLTKR